MDKRKMKTALRNIGSVIFSLLLGAAGGLAIMGYFQALGDDVHSYDFLTFFLVIPIAFFLNVVMHEAGHLVFGLLTGYKFGSFRIYSFMWMKENGRLKLKRLKIVGTAGQCLMIPPDSEDGKFPTVIYNLGGCIMNLFVSLIFLAVYLVFSGTPVIAPLAFAISTVGILLALMNGIPMRTATIDNDGYNAIALSKNREAMEAFRIQLMVVEQNAKGVRLKDMPSEWFEVPSDEAMKNSMISTRGVFACNRLMDEERFEDAEALMKHMLEIESGMVEIYRSLLMVDRIYIELISENRRIVVYNRLTKEQKRFMKAMRRFPSVIRTEYALALLYDNDKAKAEKLEKEFEKVAKSYPHPHEIDSERELMRIAENKYLILQEV